MSEDLGGHLKTGHRWTLQNRPTEQSQNKSIYTLPEAAQANIFLKSDRDGVYTDFTWAEDTATQGCDRSADSAAGMARSGASRSASQAAILARSDKSQGYGDGVPI
jgi:hypothetical protein